MSNAYDRVEWFFLGKMIEKIGFPNIYRELMIRYVSSVIYFVLINGDPSSSIYPFRGLRQGDPLSPYLILIYVESFSTMIRKAKACGDLDGVKICR